MVAHLNGLQIRLSAAHCETIVELVLRGSRGKFDMTALHDLCRQGIAEVNATTRKVCLTAHGEEVYRQLANGKP
jgi:hypothetical protein